MPNGEIGNYVGGVSALGINGASGEKLVLVYNDTGSSISNGAIKVLSFKVDATDTSNPILYVVPNVPATETTESNVLGVANNAILGLGTIANATYGYFQISGTCQALVDGTTDVAVGDQLEVIDAGTAFIKGAAASSGDSGALVPEAAAIALEARTTNSAGLQKVYLVGKPCQVKAS